MWGHRIQFIHGSVLDEQTLKRVVRINYRTISWLGIKLCFYHQ